MWENIMKFFRKIAKKEEQTLNSKDAAKERLHLVLMQDRANVSADFLELMKQEIIEVIKKYIDVDENAIDVRLTNKDNGDGTKGAPALYANIPIINLKDEVKQRNKNVVQEGEQESISNLQEDDDKTKEDHISEENEKNQEEVLSQENGETQEIEEDIQEIKEETITQNAEN